MSLLLTDSGYYRGEQLDPPTYESDNPAECAKCMVEIDLDDEPHLEMDDGSVLCEDCRKMCAGPCGEWLTDMESAIHLRCPATGRLEPWCVKCAAEDWIVRLLEFSADDPPWREK